MRIRYDTTNFDCETMYSMTFYVDMSEQNPPAKEFLDYLHTLTPQPNHPSITVVDNETGCIQLIIPNCLMRDHARSYARAALTYVVNNFYSFKKLQTERERILSSNLRFFNSKYFIDYETQ